MGSLQHSNNCIYTRMKFTLGLKDISIYSSMKWTGVAAVFIYSGHIYICSISIVIIVHLVFEDVKSIKIVDC